MERRASHNRSSKRDTRQSIIASTLEASVAGRSASIVRARLLVRMTKKLMLPLSLLVLLAAAAGYFLLRVSGADRPSMVLISIDTLRADHLSAYGYHRPTPNIDALAAQGVLFRRAHTTAPWTLPAGAGIRCCGG